MAVASDEEDDYMSMAIPEPETLKFESSAQRRVRQKREAEARAHPKSKAELAAAEAQAREDALSTELDQSSKGFKMLSKLGYKAGSALGAENRLDARLEPIGIEVKEGRSGIGLDSEKKRKFKEEVEGEAKRVKAEEGEYRERVAREREERRYEGMLRGAMLILEKFDEEDATDGAAGGGWEADEETRQDAQAISESERDSKHAKAIGVQPANKSERSSPLSKVNVLYRSLVRQRVLAERERRMRYDLHQSLSRNPNYAEDEDNKHKIMLGQEEEELEEDDAELAEFEALELRKRFEKVLNHLRTSYHYCFWCKFKCTDEKMEGCPGLLEDDHD